MTQYAKVDKEGRLFRTCGRPEPEGMGPFEPCPYENDEEGDWHFVPEGVGWSGRPSDTAVMMWNDGAPAWAETATIEQRRAARAEIISAACRAHIEQGFACSALGAEYRYPAKAQDQANLVASVTDSLLFADDPEWVTPFWCADGQGVWEFRLHARAQIQQVGREGKASILTAMQKNEILQRQIATASAEELQNIVW